ncbi:hypothetical protein, partial [Pseudomonas sp.]|uniref:hypothetical protein n=1 Tax=Pseudomonas sp. TaxID=306 RepID=UPI002FCAE1A3
MKQKMIVPRRNNEAKRLLPASPITFLEKPVEHSARAPAQNSIQTCRRKKAGNFPAAASYTRF